jgi:hypothetical protein
MNATPGRFWNYEPLRWKMRWPVDLANNRKIWPPKLTYRSRQHLVVNRPRTDSITPVAGDGRTDLLMLSLESVDHPLAPRARLRLENLAQLPFRPQHAIDDLMEKRLGRLKSNGASPPRSRSSLILAAASGDTRSSCQSRLVLVAHDNVHAAVERFTRLRMVDRPRTLPDLHVRRSLAKYTVLSMSTYSDFRTSLAPIACG